MNIVIAAGGTGGHIFPALSVALELKKQHPDISLLWLGTARNREQELCERYAIPIKLLDVLGIDRRNIFKALRGLMTFLRAVLIMRKFFTKHRPQAVIAFGGYVCAPVLGAARLNRIPYFLQEQNTVPGLVNRLFAGRAQEVFLGFALQGKNVLKGNTTVTGTPVRTAAGTYDDFPYPETFRKDTKTVLICGGSQGAASMNECLVSPVKAVLHENWQVVWQTGDASFIRIKEQMNGASGIYIFNTIDDLYPYYAAADLVICRSGASTLNEVAYFGLPCVMIPLPWAAENHQWINAGHVETQGWGVRIAQDKTCSAEVEKVVIHLMSDMAAYEIMCKKALDYSPDKAAKIIVKKIMQHVR